MFEQDKIKIAAQSLALLLRINGSAILQRVRAISAGHNGQNGQKGGGQERTLGGVYLLRCAMRKRRVL